MTKDQSPSTLAEEFAAAIYRHDSLAACMEGAPGPDVTIAQLGNFVMDNAPAILSALRSPTREAARSEALREAALVATEFANDWQKVGDDGFDPGDYWNMADGAKTVASAILALQDRATSGTTAIAEAVRAEREAVRSEALKEAAAVVDDVKWLDPFYEDLSDEEMRAVREAIGIAKESILALQARATDGEKE